MSVVLEVGRCRINDDLIFAGEVTGGGAHGPGRVLEVTGYESRDLVRMIKDNRSGSKRSGHCVWQLSANCIYVLAGIADGSRSSGDYYVSTYGGAPAELTLREFQSELEQRYPNGKAKAEEEAKIRHLAAEQRAARELEEAQERRRVMEQRAIETEALREINAEKAAEIAEKGQELVEGLPELTGTPKQIAYALSIRDAFAKKHPGDAALKRGTTAKYWIDNHRTALY